FKSEITTSTSGAADTMSIQYDPTSAGISTFNICINRGWDAPSGVSGGQGSYGTALAAATGNFDNGTSAEDVRLTWTLPSIDTPSSANVQRANKDNGGGTLDSSECTDGGSPNPNGDVVQPPGNGTLGLANAQFSTVGTGSTPSAGENTT